MLINDVNSPAPCGGRGHKAVTAVALIKVALPPELPCPTCMPTSPANCWWCVGSAGSGWYEHRGATVSDGSATESRVGAVGQCCVLALCCGPAVASGLHGTGMGMGHHWHLHGVGLAGAWVWGATAIWPVWSGPGLGMLR
jgi:hypothetical protein